LDQHRMTHIEVFISLHREFGFHQKHCQFIHQRWDVTTQFTPCSLGLSATSQQYFSLRTNQPPATSQNQPAVLFSQNKPAPAISHQPTEQALSDDSFLSKGYDIFFWSSTRHAARLAPRWTSQGTRRPHLFGGC
jgi:hypothetical protein